MPIAFDQFWVFALANLAVMAAAFVQASAGIGFSMIAAPLLALMDPSLVPGPVLILLLSLALLMSWQERAHIDKQGLPILFVGIFGGTVAAVSFLSQLDQRNFDLLFGSVLAIALIVTIQGWRVRRDVRTLGIGGIICGLMGTVSGIHGPPLAVIYRDADLACARATIATIFSVATTMALLLLLTSGLVNLSHGLAGLSLIPSLLIGLAIAKRMRNALPVIWIKRATFAMVGMSAVLLILRGTL